MLQLFFSSFTNFKMEITTLMSALMVMKCPCLDLVTTLISVPWMTSSLWLDYTASTASRTSMKESVELNPIKSTKGKWQSGKMGMNMQ